MPYHKSNRGGKEGVWEGRRDTTVKGGSKEEKKSGGDNGGRDQGITTEPKTQGVSEVETGAQQATSELEGVSTEVETEGRRSLAEQEGWRDKAQPEDW